MKSVLVFGDSLSWGRVPGQRERHVFEDRWPNIVSNALGDDVRVIEECLPGRTTVFDDPFPGRSKWASSTAYDLGQPSTHRSVHPHARHQ